MTTKMMLDYIGICLDSNQASDLNFTVNLVVSDFGEEYTLIVRSGILMYQKGKTDHADATWTMPKAGLFAIISKDSKMQAEQIQQSGDKALLEKMSENIMSFDFFFNIVEP